MTGEIAGYTMEKLFEAGALDVFYTPIYMKKNRPAIKISVICEENLADDIQHIILTQSSTIGMRKYKTERVCMERKFISVKTPYGSARIKETVIDDIKKYYPEYEDCKKIADAEGIPLREVYDMALAEYKN